MFRKLLNLAPPQSISRPLLLTLAFLVLMLAYSPIADRIASRFTTAPPNLRAFRPLQQSRTRLVLGILIAWLLGAFAEELALRGLLLPATRAAAQHWLPAPLATALAIGTAALAAAILHCYQGPRAMLIIAQLSALFGLLFILSNDNLWPVILCHGLYDTIAFIRFATGKSRWSRPNPRDMIRT